MRSRTRVATVRPPDERGALAGLAYTLWRPPDPVGGVVIVHGAGSVKENHHDFARACRASGLAAVCFDLRGHGDSDGALGADALDDLAAMAGLLAPLPVALGGSSLGGYLALAGAERAGAAAVVAICPASGEMLLRGLRAGAFDFRADTPALEELLAEHDVAAAAEALDVPVLLLHAEGDERVPVEHSRELARRLRSSRSRLLAVPGGHHRSVQHDPDLQAFAVRWLVRELGG